MSGLQCQHCTAATSNGLALCKACQTTTRVSLENIAAYHPELFSLGGQVTRVRTRGGFVSDPTGSAASRIEVTADEPDALAAETRNALHGWTRLLINDRPGVSWPADTVTAMAACLSRHLLSIATTEWADAMMRDLLGFEQRLRKVVERGKGRWYAGICSAPLTDTDPVEFCERDLYAIPGTSYVRCPVCRTDHSVSARRTMLLAEARETLLPISVIASAAVTLLGDEPSVGRLEHRLQKWAQRGQIQSYGVKVIGGQERRVYGFGEVLDMLTTEAAGVKR